MSKTLSDKTMDLIAYLEAQRFQPGASKEKQAFCLLAAQNLDSLRTHAKSPRKLGDGLREYRQSLIAKHHLLVGQPIDMIRVHQKLVEKLGRIGTHHPTTLDELERKYR
jgi:hypothetical protein